MTRSALLTLLAAAFTVPELKGLAKTAGMSGYSSLNQDDLIDLIVDTVPVSGTGDDIWAHVQDVTGDDAEAVIKGLNVAWMGDLEAEPSDDGAEDADNEDPVEPPAEEPKEPEVADADTDATPFDGEDMVFCKVHTPQNIMIERTGEGGRGRIIRILKGDVYKGHMARELLKHGSHAVTQCNAMGKTP